MAKSKRRCEKCGNSRKRHQTLCKRCARTNFLQSPAEQPKTEQKPRHSNWFNMRLVELGCASYNDYLFTLHWTEFKARRRTADLPQDCAVCGNTKVDLHHVTYERLGCEELTDVIPLCRVHHEAVHAWLKEKSWSVRMTFKAVEALCGKPEKPPQGPTKKTREVSKRKSIRKARRIVRKHQAQLVSKLGQELSARLDLKGAYSPVWKEILARCRSEDLDVSSVAAAAAQVMEEFADRLPAPAAAL